MSGTSSKTKQCQQKSRTVSFKPSISLVKLSTKSTDPIMSSCASPQTTPKSVMSLSASPKNNQHVSTPKTLTSLSASVQDKPHPMLSKESYAEYLQFISAHDFKRESWIYDILHGKKEHDLILFQDEQILIIPNYSWNGRDLTKMHVLVFAIDTSLHSLRDLTGKHVELLKYIKIKALSTIKESYDLDESMIKMYVHYSPTYYHLHIHFAAVSNNRLRSSTEYSHNLDTVTDILEMKSDYYQTVSLNKRI